VRSGAWTARNALKREPWATCSPSSSSKQASRCSTCGRSSPPGRCDVSDAQTTMQSGTDFTGTRKRPSHELTGIGRSTSLVLRERVDWGNRTSGASLFRTDATPPLRAACLGSTWACRDLSRTILCHPLSGWPSMSTSHTRLLPRSSRIPHHQHALNLKRLNRQGRTTCSTSTPSNAQVASFTASPVMAGRVPTSIASSKEPARECPRSGAGRLSRDPARHPARR